MPDELKKYMVFQNGGQILIDEYNMEDWYICLGIPSMDFITFIFAIDLETAEHTYNDLLYKELEKEEKEEQRKKDLHIDYQEEKIALEKKYFVRAIKACNGSLSKAANLLGISRTHMYKKAKKYNLNLKEIKWITELQ